MMTLPELKRTAGREGVPQAVIEADYALSVALDAVAESGFAGHLVFKGGTAIRKVYFGTARFSEDLDFTVVGIGKDAVMRGLAEILAGRTIGGIAFGMLEEEETRAGLKVAIMFTGPLGHRQRIRFDFSFRENLAGGPEQRELIDAYGVGKRKITVMSIGEILAEKIHALGSRAAPRDLYDVWFLLSNGVRPDPEMIRKKFAYYHERPDLVGIMRHIDHIRAGWKRDLERLLPRLPNYEENAGKVKEALAAILRET